MRTFQFSIFGLALTILCCGCARPDVSGQPASLLSQVPIESATFAADYQRLASCSYLRLDKASGNGIKKIDLPNESASRLALESGGVRYWELVFTAVAKNKTRVDFSMVQTMWGPLGSKEVMPEVRACVAAQASPG